MLVLGRKVGEEIRIGDNIVVVVNKISGNRVSIGIQAPSDVSILRGEIPIRESNFEETVVYPNEIAAPVSGCPITFELDSEVSLGLTPNRPR